MQRRSSQLNKQLMQLQKRKPEKNQACELLQKHVKLRVLPVAFPGQIHNQDSLKKIKKLISGSLSYIFPITSSLLPKNVVSSFRSVRCRLSTEFTQVWEEKIHFSWTVEKMDLVLSPGTTVFQTKVKK